MRKDTNLFVGLPGSGIGGLYYIIMALFMPVCEIYQTVRGRSSAARWRVVGIQVGYAAAILAALAVAGKLLLVTAKWTIGLVSASPAAAEAMWSAAIQPVSSIMWSWMAWVSALTLLTVIIVPAAIAAALSLHERIRAAKWRVKAPAESSDMGLVNEDETR